MRWPSFDTDRLALESHGEEQVELLLSHYKTRFGYLGGDPAKARCEWRRLKCFVGREATLISLSYLELYERLFNQKGNKFMYGTDGTCSDKLDDMSFYNILLLLSIISHTLSTPPSASGALDAATVACQKSGIYPTFDSAAGLG